MQNTQGSQEQTYTETITVWAHIAQTTLRMKRKYLQLLYLQTIL